MYNKIMSMKTLEKPKQTYGHDDYFRSLPSFSLTASELPAVKDWKVGSKYTLTIEVEMTSASKNEYQKELTAGFQITKIGEEDSEDTKKAKKGY